MRGKRLLTHLKFHGTTLKWVAQSNKITVWEWDACILNVQEMYTFKGRKVIWTVNIAFKHTKWKAKEICGSSNNNKNNYNNEKYPKISQVACLRRLLSRNSVLCLTIVISFRFVMRVVLMNRAQNQLPDSINNSVSDVSECECECVCMQLSVYVCMKYPTKWMCIKSINKQNCYWNNSVVFSWMWLRFFYYYLCFSRQTNT